MTSLIFFIIVAYICHAINVWRKRKQKRIEQEKKIRDLISKIHDLQISITALRYANSSMKGEFIALKRSYDELIRMYNVMSNDFNTIQDIRTRAVVILKYKIDGKDSTQKFHQN